MVNWQNISPRFTEELEQEWINKGFSCEEAKDWINIGLKSEDYEFASWLKDIKKVDAEWVLNQGNSEELRKEYQENSKDYKEKEEIRNILIIGKTGNGKSALGNVLLNKNDNFEKVFEEKAGGASVTKNIHFEKMEVEKIKYRIIDTIGFSDTEKTVEEIILQFRELIQIIQESSLNQILFVTDGRFTNEELLAYKMIGGIFGEEAYQCTTIVRTNFPDFRDEKRRGEDKEEVIEIMSKNRDIKLCDKFIYVDNPSTDVKIPDEKRKKITDELNKGTRGESREIILKHLEKYSEVYGLEHLTKKQTASKAGAVANFGLRFITSNLLSKGIIFVSTTVGGPVGFVVAAGGTAVFTASGVLINKHAGKMDDGWSKTIVSFFGDIFTDTGIDVVTGGVIGEATKVAKPITKVATKWIGGTAGKEIAKHGVTNTAKLMINTGKGVAKTGKFVVQNPQIVTGTAQATAQMAQQVSRTKDEHQQTPRILQLYRLDNKP